MVKARYWSVLSLAMLTLGGCKSATQAKLGLYTNVGHEDGISVAVWAGADTATAVQPQVAVAGPWTGDGRIGDVVLVPPSGIREARLGLRAVMAIGRDPATCSVQDARNCIIARRQTRYVAAQTLNIPVSFFAQCLGVACDDGTTCNSQGRCVSAQLDPVACTSEGGCVLEGDPPTPPSVQPKPAPPVDAGVDASPGPAPVPPDAPSASYRDQTPERGLTHGKLVLKAAATGPAPQGFELRWSDALGNNTAPFADVLPVPAAGATLEHAVLPGTRVPSTLDHFQVRSFYLLGDSSRLYSPPVRLRADNFVRIVDIGGTAGVDGFSGKFFLGPGADEITLGGVDEASHPTLRRCKNDGSGCTARQLSATILSARGIGTVMDPVGDHTLMAVTNNVDERAYLIACKLDGTSCTTRDMYDLAGLTGRQAMSFQGLFDKTAQKALFVTTSIDTGRHLVFRCDLDGKACSVRIMEDDAGVARATFGYDFSTALDETSRTLLTVASDGTGGAATNRQNLVLFRCGLDAPGCTYTDISAQVGSDGFQELRPRIAIDDAARKLRILTTGFPDSADPRVFSTNIDGTGAQVRSLAGFNLASTSYSSSSFDPVAGKLHVLLGTSNSYPVLLRCAPDGSGCAVRDLFAATGASSGGFFLPNLLALSGTDRVLIQSANSDKQARPWLFSCPVTGLACAQADLSVSTQFGNAVGGNVVGRKNGVEWSIHGDVDVVSKKLMVVGMGSASDLRPLMIRCDLDASNCLSTDASADQANASGFYPWIHVAPSGTRAVIGASDFQTGRNGRLSLYLCPSDGSRCTWRDASGGTTGYAGQPVLGSVPGSNRLRAILGGRTFGTNPAYLVDCDPEALDCKGLALGSLAPMDREAAAFEAGQGIAVLSKGGNSRELVRCNADSPAVCTSAPLVGPALPPAFSTIRFDDLRNSGASDLAFAATLRGPSEPAFMLALCDNTGAQCRTRVFTVAPGVLRYGSNVLHAVSRLVVDDAAGVVYFAHTTTSALVAVGVTELWRCTTKDLACERLALSTDIHTAVPVPVIDRVNGRLHVLASNASAGRRPVTITVDLW
jgi:hypothetical protein